MNTPSVNPHTRYKSAVYARYADDWVLRLTGTQQKDGIKIKSEISFFIDQELQLKLDEKKTLITKLHSGLEFLGFMIRAWSYKQLKVSNVTQFRSIDEDKIYT